MTYIRFHQGDEGEISGDILSKRRQALQVVKYTGTLAWKKNADLDIKHQIKQNHTCALKIRILCYRVAGFRISTWGAVTWVT